MLEKIAFVTSVSVGFSAGLKHFAQPRPRDLLGFNIASARRRPQHSADNVTKISHEDAISYLLGPQASWSVERTVKSAKKRTRDLSENQKWTRMCMLWTRQENALKLISWDSVSNTGRFKTWISPFRPPSGPVVDPIWTPIWIPIFGILLKKINGSANARDTLRESN